MTTETRVPGFSDIINSVAETIQGLSDAIRGYTIRPAATVPRGERTRIRTDGGQLVICMHPLDAITEAHAGDPHKELEEALAWIVEQAHDELDKLIADAHLAVVVGTMRQDDRMNAWLLEHRMTEDDLLLAANGMKAYQWVTVRQLDGALIQKRVMI